MQVKSINSKTFNPFRALAREKSKRDLTKANYSTPQRSLLLHKKFHKVKFNYYQESVR